MKDDLKVFDKMYARMISSKRGNMTRQDVEAFKYTFSRIGMKSHLKKNTIFLMICQGIVISTKYFLLFSLFRGLGWTNQLYSYTSTTPIEV